MTGPLRRRLPCVCVLLVAGAGVAIAAPDLVVDRPTLEASVGVSMQVFAPNACELGGADLCLGGPGARKLLKFSVLAANAGDTDLVLGKPNPADRLPNGEPKWVFSACHGHWHFQTFARYELRRRGETTPFLTGAKRSFCVEDTRRVTATSDPKYCCNLNPSCPDPTQGVQAGWGDLYPSNLPCQWIDITDGATPGSDLPPGEYDVCVFLNTAQQLPEASYANDVECVPVTIEAPARAAPRVKVRRPNAKTKAAVGAPVKIQWKRKGRIAPLFQEVWTSIDGGGTWTLVGQNLPAKTASFAWTPEAASDAARVRVVVWQRFPRDGTGAGAYQRGLADSASFRITP